MPQDTEIDTETESHPKVSLPDFPPLQHRIFEIRAIALSALLVGPDHFQAWRYFGELKGMPKSARRAAWLEGMIATCVAGRIRPAFVVRMLKNLRLLREGEDASDKFAAFEALLQQGLGEKRLTNHGYRQQSFGDMEHGAIWDRTGRHIGFLKDQGYEVFLNSGTLLGVVRDGRLIDHDDDIDLAIVLKAGSHEEAAREWAGLREALQDSGHLDEEQPVPGLFKLTAAGDVQIDLFPAWFQGDRFFVYPHSHGELSRADVFPLRACPVTGHPIPANPEKMLANNYGPGWQSPDPYFKFPWASARSKFQSFLSELA